MSSANSKLKILFVDDEYYITVVMKSGLEKRGCSVDIFNSPSEALSQFKPSYYDAIVLDVRMPGMSGFELAKQIWSIDVRARICFLSAFEIYESEARKVFKEFKTHCFIKKPIMPGELIRHIEAHSVTAI